METSSKFSITGFANESARSLTEGRRQENAEPAKEFPQWSSRTMNLLAYTIVAMCYPGFSRGCFALGHYGGAIFIPYILFKVLFAIPMILVEVLQARYVTGYFIRVFALCQLGAGLLICRFIATSLTMFYHLVNTVYLVIYLGSVLSGRIMWEHCEEPWATGSCYEIRERHLALQKCLKVNERAFCDNQKRESSGRQFWNNVIHNRNFKDYLIYAIPSLVVPSVIVVIINYKGIRSLEKTLIFFVSMAVALSVIFTMVTFLTPGSVEGFQKLWTLNTSLLLEPEIWMKAFEDAVMTQCIGLFVLYLIASHGYFDDDIFFDGLIILFCDFLSGLFTAVPVLSIIKTINKENKIFNDYADVYVWISEAFNVYPYPNTLWAFVFYLKMTLLQLSTQSIFCLSVTEVIFCLFKERFNIFYVGVCVAVYNVAATALLLVFPSVIDFPLSATIITTVFLNLTIVELVYGLRKFNDDFHFMMGYHPPFLLDCLLVLATILSLAYLLVLSFQKPKDRYKIYVSILIPVGVLICVGAFYLYRGYKHGNIWQVFAGSKDWGPSIPLLRKSRIVFDSKTITKEYMYRQELYKKPQMKPNDFHDQNIICQM